ncbi:20S-pre-rRNA D-site endonuclease NOB1 [Nakaseomyces glabratus]|uniref:20S-pre-rRNA D-site endonuclease NOB1 n=1 Tax=Candida glabrata TaxID=5478 RepID=A0A0W0D710_CANGB|nr:20S-pre-rRNA D-site endonuclease NOB1 [Nakaseomyces glabratus]KTB21302.1 20S-pre-rRNA D-site endonuclease NOB1 [Nakaseomyces glabratus]
MRNNEHMMTVPHVNSLVLDATPLITQPYNHYQYYAEKFYTTPTVFHEIKDANARKNLEVWQSLGNLQLVHPRKESIDRVSNFARLTGDYSVLSANDIHILALTYELEKELNKGDWRLRRKPGDKLKHEIAKLRRKPGDKLKHEIAKPAKNPAEKPAKHAEDKEEVKAELAEGTEASQEIKKKPRRRGGKKQKAKREQRLAEQQQQEGEQEQEQPEQEQMQPVQEQADDETKQDGMPTEASTDEINEEYDEGDDDGEWITPDNLTETLIRDSGEDTTGSKGVLTASGLDSSENPENQVALATGDFAVQNVALQMNLNLMNFMSGMRIKRLRNYMLRCHACFRMFPLPKDGKAKHFCPSCGGQGTLLRCAVTVDATTGEVTPHLKNNFQWKNRGNRYSMASPLSKNAVKRYGKKGHQHANNTQDAPILREDQKEYEKAIKQEEWTRRHNEKVLNNWIGGGSADNYISPFAISGLKQHSVRVGKGRYVNSSKRKK